MVESAAKCWQERRSRDGRRINANYDYGFFTVFGDVRVSSHSTTPLHFLRIERHLQQSRRTQAISGALDITAGFISSKRQFNCFHRSHFARRFLLSPAALKRFQELHFKRDLEPLSALQLQLTLQLLWVLQLKVQLPPSVTGAGGGQFGDILTPSRRRIFSAKANALKILTCSCTSGLSRTPSTASITLQCSSHRWKSKHQSHQTAPYRCRGCTTRGYRWGGAMAVAGQRERIDWDYGGALGKKALQCVFHST